MKYTKLQTLLKDVNGASFININTLTEVKLTGGKSNPFQGRVTKEIAGSNVMVFQNKKANAYENMVNRRLNKEGKSASFTVGPRQWGHRIPNTPFVEHNGQHYLEVIFLKSGIVQYYVDNKPYFGHIEGLPSPTDSDQGGLDDKVIIRTFKVDSIQSITINGARHNL